MLSRTGLIQETGLDIPAVSVEEGRAGRNSAGEDGIQPGGNSIARQDLYPEKEFNWESSEDPDGSVSLLISIYPFYYDNATGDSKFYQNYSFAINYSVSSVEITGINTDKDNYIQGEAVTIEFGVNNSGSEMDITVNGTIESYGTGTLADSLPLQNLVIGSGTTNSSLSWNSSGIDSGYYLAKIILEDSNGYKLDSAVSRFKLGIESGEISRFEAMPRNLTLGESLNISMYFNNTGTENLTGIATIRIFDSNGSLAEEFTHDITDLVPGSKTGFEDSWTPEEAGIYEIIGFVLYQGNSAGPESSLVNVIEEACDVKGDADCDGTVSDFELLAYINDWSIGLVLDFDLLAAINNWANP